MMPRTGNVLFILIQVAFAIWIMSVAFANPPVWIHGVGVIAIILLLIRIFRGDD